MNGVRHLLKNKETERYLGRGGKWTDKPESAMAFLDQTRASDYRIYHRLFDTEVVELADRGSANTPPAAPTSVSQTHGREEPVTKSRKTKGRVPKPAASKVEKGQATEKESTAPQACKAPGNKPLPALSSIGDQLSVIAEPSTLLTTVEAKLDVGYGNSLFIRGQGDGLSWERGTPLQCQDASTWLWSTRAAKDKVVFKLLLNDQLWAKGQDLVVEAGKKLEVVPSF